MTYEHSKQRIEDVIITSKRRFCVIIDLIDKSHNAPLPYPTMHHSEQNVHISVLNGVFLWDMGQVHHGICEIGLLRFHWHFPFNENPKMVKIFTHQQFFNNRVVITVIYITRRMSTVLRNSTPWMIYQGNYQTRTRLATPCQDSHFLKMCTYVTSTS